jgi:hypothetical protein
VDVVRTDVSEERVASIYRIEKIRQASVRRRKVDQLFFCAVDGAYHTYTMKIKIVAASSTFLARLFFFSILKIVATRSPETDNIQTASHISEDGILHGHRRENLKILQNFTWSHK